MPPTRQFPMFLSTSPATSTLSSIPMVFAIGNLLPGPYEVPMDETSLPDETKAISLETAETAQKISPDFAM